ncbi:MAG TPA: PLP-dependent aminotransferase family protein [Kofleriaceae bacterium]|nr:PLP-dependent aminotransferase family protein [Kofleriaceae bacterium]
MDPRFVALQKRAAECSDVIGLAGGLPADELLPRDELAQALADVTASRKDALQYGWPEGVEQLRTWIANRLAARGATVEPDRVIITAGAQQALSIAGAMFAGRAIAVGAATYPAAIQAFLRAGARVVEHGGDARYVIVGVANPQGVALDESLGEIPLIVDEAYAELRFDGELPPLLQAAAPDRVWHVGTISKTLAPGLRVGWLVPPAAEHEAALAIKHAADLQTASLSQAALARFLATFDYDHFAGRARAAYAERASALVTGMRRHAPMLEFTEPDGGFSIWIETDVKGDEVALLKAALAEGVMVDPGSEFRALPDERIAFRVSYSHVGPEQLDEGARRVARMFERFVRE